VVIILFGGPVLDHIQHTFLLAANIAVLAFFPLFYIYGVDGDAWVAIATAAMPLDDSYGGLLGGVVGAWLGAVPIPLDWDREWQKWPVTILVGLYGGYVLGKLIGGTLAYGRRFGGQKTEALSM
jgi:GPI ethanolamine phosphate transferase 2/3 subunit F